MLDKKTYLVLLFIAFGLAASGCGLFESGSDAPTPTIEATEPAVTPLVDEGTADEDPLETETPHPESSFSAYWSEAIDDRTGIRFAVPCFWEVRLPELDPTGWGDFFVRNYDEEFVLSHPRGYVWDTGAMKIDFSYIQPSSYGLPSESSPSEVAIALGGDLSELVGTEAVTINGQAGTLVTSKNTENLSTGQYYLIKMDADLFLLFAAAPDGALESADVQGILHSIALTQAVAVQIPGALPGPPPEGFYAACLKDLYSSSDTTPLSNELACEGVFVDTALSLACQVQDALMARDIDQLRSLMKDPFAIGYWQSEGVESSPDAASAELDRYRLPADASGLTFTTDRSQFPPLFGMPPENMFGPDANVELVVYSEGWGTDGFGAALLFISHTDGGSYDWHGMVVAPAHFDM
jgi:hypothetical protein